MISEAVTIAAATMTRRLSASTRLPETQPLRSMLRVHLTLDLIIRCPLSHHQRRVDTASIHDGNVSAACHTLRHRITSVIGAVILSRSIFPDHCQNVPILQALQRIVDGMRRHKFAEPLLRHVSAGTDAFFRRAPSLQKI
jgi:hypothetical protein